MDSLSEDPEKKKHGHDQLKKQEDLPLPAKSEYTRQDNPAADKSVNQHEVAVGKHDPVIQKPSKTFSIKNVISEENKPVEEEQGQSESPGIQPQASQKEEFDPAAFEVAWLEFTDTLAGEGTRIVSMFKSIKPESGNDQTIKIHLSNAAQRDTFVQNYKQRLLTFLESRFIMSGIDIETVIDIADTTDILYTDEQKYTYLINKYPILKEMKKTFNLDIT
jgi:hypothetical protein